MRIVSEDEFLELPNGTVYAEVSYGGDKELLVKGHTSASKDDFCYRHVWDWNAPEKEDYLNYMHQVVDDNGEMQLSSEGWASDNDYDSDYKYWVFSKSEVLEIIHGLMRDCRITLEEIRDF